MLPERPLTPSPGVGRRHPRPARRSTSTGTRRRRRWAEEALAGARELGPRRRRGRRAGHARAGGREPRATRQKAQARLAEARDRAPRPATSRSSCAPTTTWPAATTTPASCRPRWRCSTPGVDPGRGDRPDLQPVRVGAAGPAGDRAVRGRRLGRQPGGGRAGRRPHAGLGAGPAGRGRALRRGRPAGCPPRWSGSRQLRGAWSQDTSLALVAGGCEADLLRWRGDLDGAVRRGRPRDRVRQPRAGRSGISAASGWPPSGWRALADRAETARLRGDDGGRRGRPWPAAGS